MSYQRRIPYNADEMEARQRELPEWEQRLKEAEEKLKNSKSSNYVSCAIEWSNIRGVRDYIKSRLEAMLKDMES